MLKDIYYCPLCSFVYNEKIVAIQNESWYMCGKCKNHFRLSEYDNLSLKVKRGIDKTEIIPTVEKLANEGFSVRKIAEELHIGKTYIGYIVKDLREAKKIKYIHKSSKKRLEHRTYIDYQVLIKKAFANQEKIPLKSLIKNLLKLSCSRALIYTIINEKVKILKPDSKLIKHNKKQSIEVQIVGDTSKVINDKDNHIGHMTIDRFVSKFPEGYNKTPLYKISTKEKLVFIDTVTVIINLILCKSFLDTKKHIFTKRNLKQYLARFNIYIKVTDILEIFENYNFTLKDLRRCASCYQAIANKNPELTNYDIKLPNGYMIKFLEGKGKGTRVCDLNEECKKYFSDLVLRRGHLGDSCNSGGDGN